MSELTWTTAVTKIKPNEIRLRGYRIDELMGKVSFAEAVYLALKGELPTRETGDLINAILVASIDHGATPPSVLAARTIASTGAPLNAAVAGGILSINKWHGGAIEECMNHLQDVKKIMTAEGLNAAEAAKKLVTKARERKEKLSGFGHRVHTNDPRTARLFELAEKAGLTGGYVEIGKAVAAAIKEVMGKALPMNVDGAIAAILCELGFAPEIANAFFMIARVPGLVAHVYEEQTVQKSMRQIHPSDHDYNGPEDRSL